MGVRDGADAIRRALGGPNGLLAVALTLAATSIVEVSIYRDDNDREVASLLNLCATLPLGIGRRWPWPVAAVITLANVVAISQPDPLFTVSGMIAQLVAVYLVARRDPRWASALLTLPFVINAISPLTGDDEDALEGVLLLVLVVSAQVLGDIDGRRGAAVAERDATRIAMADALREQAVLAERNRIAHELHDIVAHHISMISVQAETARVTTEGMPDEGKQRLAAIGDTARDALGEMRRLLGLLGEGEAAERMPQPGLAQLDDLLAAARSAGTTVRLVLEGAAAPLPRAADLAAYRIVQESLTNARRHAPGATVTVQLHYGAETLALRVVDDGPGPSAEDAPHEGHGLLGMAERAQLVGGTLRTGRAPQGGLMVEAELPVRE